MDKKTQTKLNAIHILLVEGRTLSYEKKIEILPEFFDQVEYLMAIILNEQHHEINAFDDYLQYTCETFNCLHIYKRYKLG